MTEAAALADRSACERLLRGLAGVGEAPVDIAVAALALAAFDRPRVDPARYLHHLDLLAGDVAAAAAKAKGVAQLAAALNAVMLERYGYAGDELTYDDLQNANLMRVIDRRRGLPVALGILYMHAARAQGWAMCGLAFPGHFLVRLEAMGDRTILDPFHGGAVRNVKALRELLKTMSGRAAELEPEHYAPVPDRQVLLRLQNNIKLRLVRGNRLAEALAVIEGMLLFAPDHTALWREAALINGRLGNYRAGIAALEQLLQREGEPEVRHNAAALLQQYKTKLN